jgi:hypothetical protein
VFIAAAPAAAQSPVINAKVETRAASRSVAEEMQAVADRGIPIWAGYRVPMVARTFTGLQYMGTRGRCRLEPPAELVVLARFEARTLVELRPVSVDCDVDAAGMPLVWLSDVSADRSVAWLASIVADGDAGRRSTRLADPALAAIGLHAAPAASRTLVGLARDGQTTGVRGQALIWLAQHASAQAGSVIAEAIERDPEVEVKRRAVIALGRLPREEGVPLLIDVARSNRSTALRRQAMQTLGQSNDPRALAFFEQVLLK